MSNEKSTSLSDIHLRLIKSSSKIATRKPALDDISYQHAVLCQTCLPYRNPGEDVKIWKRKQGKAMLAIQANQAFDPNIGDFVHIGLPYGPKARLILAHINSEAIRNQSQTVDVGDSMTFFVRKLGLDTGGRTINSIKDQIRRLSVAMISLAYADDERMHQLDGKIIDQINVWFPKDANQRVLWDSTVELGDRYYQSLLNHAVPLDDRSLAALSHTAMGLDIYTWLVHRLHRIDPKQPQFVAWANLKDQFGQGVGRMDNFRRNFNVALREVLTQYPAAKVEVIGTKGLKLHQSRPPIDKKLIAVSKKG